MPDFEQRMQIEMPSPSKLFTPAVTALLILMIAGYALVACAPSWAALLALDPEAILRGKVWALAGYVFCEKNAINLLFNLLAVLFVGNMVERQWKARSLVLLWLSASIVCGLIWTAVNLLAGKNGIGFGAGPCVYALLGAFGAMFGRRRFLFIVVAVEARWIAAIFIGVGLLMSLSRPITAVWLVGALVGYLYIFLVRRLSGGFRSGGAGSSSRTRNLEID